MAQRDSIIIPITLMVSGGGSDNIAELGAYECSSLTRLNVLEFDDGHNLTVHVKSNTVFEIACDYHSFCCSVRSARRNISFRC